MRKPSSPNCFSFIINWLLKKSFWHTIWHRMTLNMSVVPYYTRRCTRKVPKSVSREPQRISQKSLMDLQYIRLWKKNAWRWKIRRFGMRHVVQQPKLKVSHWIIECLIWHNSKDHFKNWFLVIIFLSHVFAKVYWAYNLLVWGLTLGRHLISIYLISFLK